MIFFDDLQARYNAPGDCAQAYVVAHEIGHYVSPDSFTHGSSEQRMRWFNTGLQWGELKRCDTFSVRDP